MGLIEFDILELADHAAFARSQALTIEQCVPGERLGGAKESTGVAEDMKRPEDGAEGKKPKLLPTREGVRQKQTLFILEKAS
jgi:hypothetical protein